MSTPSIQTLITQAQQVLNLKSSNEIRATLAAVLANANVGTPLNPNLTTQQLWDEFYEIVRQPSDDIMSIITDQMMRMVFSPPAPGGAGADKQVIFNDGGVLAGDPDLIFNKALNKLVANNIETAAGLLVGTSATITGDLTVDTNVLKVDTTNNRVGIGTATPGETLDVKGTGNFNNTSGTYLGFQTNAAQVGYIGTANTIITGGLNTELGLWANSSLVIATGASALQRLRVEAAGDVSVSTGNVVMGTSGKGIDFSAVTGGTGTATANVLNDYEEGVWDASFISGGGTVTINPASNQCRYTKIGRLVTVQGDVQVSSVSSPTGPLLISGLPYTIATGTEGNAYTAASLFPSGLEATATGQIVGYGVVGSVSIYMYRYEAGAIIGLAPSAKAASEFAFSMTYTV